MKNLRFTKKDMANIDLCVGYISYLIDANALGLTALQDIQHNGGLDSLVDKINLKIDNNNMTDNPKYYPSLNN